MNINLKKENKKADLQKQLNAANQNVKKLNIMINNIVLFPDKREVIELKEKIIAWHKANKTKLNQDGKDL